MHNKTLNIKIQSTTFFIFYSCLRVSQNLKLAMLVQIALMSKMLICLQGLFLGLVLIIFIYVWLIVNFVPICALTSTSMLPITICLGMDISIIIRGPSYPLYSFKKVIDFIKLNELILDENWFRVCLKSDCSFAFK